MGNYIICKITFLGESLIRNIFDAMENKIKVGFDSGSRGFPLKRSCGKKMSKQLILLGPTSAPTFHFRFVFLLVLLLLFKKLK